MCSYVYREIWDYVDTYGLSNTNTGIPIMYHPQDIRLESSTAFAITCKNENIPSWLVSRPIPDYCVICYPPGNVSLRAFTTEYK